MFINLESLFEAGLFLFGKSVTSRWWSAWWSSEGQKVSGYGFKFFGHLKVSECGLGLIIGSCGGHS